MTTGCFGRWHKLSGVGLQKFGTNNFGVVVDQHWRNPGGPSGGSEHYFGLVNGQYRNVLDLYRCYYAESMCCDWEANVVFAKSGRNFEDISVIIKSEYHKPFTLPDLPQFLDTSLVLPDGLEQYVTPVTDSFKYKKTCSFTFVNNKYVLRSTKIKVKGKNKH